MTADDGKERDGEAVHGRPSWLDQGQSEKLGGTDPGNFAVEIALPYS